ncbi:type II toxin-antitoxin system YafQ family toxin [Helicobacter sp. MIT 01-3238]|nr:type II toxin-antitoxin system YafQ family toxin [Helicobacter sp. MIT 01-3238]
MSSQIFQRLQKRAKKAKNDTQSVKLTKSIITKLANDEPLEPKHKDHKLTGQYEGFRECHIKPDLLLIYKKEERVLILTCLAIGSHSELF